MYNYHPSIFVEHFICRKIYPQDVVVHILYIHKTQRPVFDKQGAVFIFDYSSFDFCRCFRKSEKNCRKSVALSSPITPVSSDGW